MNWFWWRLAGSAAAGGLLFAAFPPRDLWALAPLAMGLLYACLRLGRPSARTGAACGGVFGLALFLPLLPWIGVYVGPLPWIALAVVSALYLVLFGAMATVTMRLPAAPLWFALCWVAVEALRSSFPFGGFPWGAVAFSQNEGWFLPLARWFGVPGLSFAVALSGAALAALIALPATTAWRRELPAVGLAALAVIAPLGVAAIAAATAPAPDGGRTVQVAAVQGNVPRLGLEFNEQRRAVLDNHVRQTLRLADEVHEGRRPQPDLVLWPENASDISPLSNPDAAAVIQTAVNAVGAPIVFGTLDYRADGRSTNTVLVWEAPGGRAAPAPTGRYDKHIVQPFGEYLPWRGFFSKFSSYADQAGDIAPGTGPSVLTVPTDAGPVVLGVSTCWEVAFDRSPQQAVRDGAQLLFVPTNNATFGRTDMTYQQLAMSQVRAVETGRATVVAATSGVSAIIAPDGTVLSRSEIFTPADLQAALPLRDGRTLAVRLGPWPQRLAIICAVGGFLYALAQHTRFKRLLDRTAPKEHDDD